MKKIIMSLSAVAAVALASLVSTPAHAADDDSHLVSVQVSGGAVENLYTKWTTPGRVFTNNAFKTGVQADGRIMFKILPNLSFGPEVGVDYLPVSGDKSNNAVVWNFGGALRLQGDRDANWSPYLQIGLAAAKQAEVFNPTLSGVIGADVALEPTHTFWLGPYVAASRTFQTHTEESQQTLLMDHHDFSTLSVGLSLSFDAPVQQKVVTKTVVADQTEVVKTVVLPAPPPTVVHVESAPVVAPAPFQITEKVMFDKNSAALSVDATKVLDQVAVEINAHPGVSVKVEGSASSDGDAAWNLSLSHLRAGNVSAYLALHGVDPARLNPVSLGAVGVAGDASQRVVDFIVINVSSK